MSVKTAVARIRGKVRARRDAVAQDVMETAAELHLSAPRGGVNKNRYGEWRSAPGEQPAIETGQLLNDIMNNVEKDDVSARVIVNYTVQEFGNRKKTLLPRPMGRMTLDIVKQKVARGADYGWTRH